MERGGCPALMTLIAVPPPSGACQVQQSSYRLLAECQNTMSDTNASYMYQHNNKFIRQRQNTIFEVKMETYLSACALVVRPPILIFSTCQKEFPKRFGSFIQYRMGLESFFYVQRLSRLGVKLRRST